MRVIVTRPALQAGPWVDLLRAQGLDAVALPLIDILPPADPEAVARAWAHLDGAALAMFVSANAVAHFFGARPGDLPQAWPAATRAGSTGPGTSAALRAQGVPAVAIVEPDAAGPFDTEALWQRLRHEAWKDRRVIIVRGDGGRDWLARQLVGAGATVDFVAAYRRVAPTIDPALVQAALRAPQHHRWHFSSSEAVDHLVDAVPGADWSHSQAYATHPRIASQARHRGFGRVALLGVGVDDLSRQLRAEGDAGASIESPSQ